MTTQEYLTLIEAAEYIGVSRVKMSNLVREGEITYSTSPLDKRVKLFRRADLDRLKAAPRPSSAQPQAAPSQPE